MVPEGREFQCAHVAGYLKTAARRAVIRNVEIYKQCQRHNCCSKHLNLIDMQIREDK
jgi:hypothetical protein